jgi:hypothetical protein
MDLNLQFLQKKWMINSFAQYVPWFVLNHKNAECVQHYFVNHVLVNGFRKIRIYVQEVNVILKIIQLNQ